MRQTEGEGVPQESQRSMLSAVVFDMDGLLLDTEHVAMVSWMHAPIQSNGELTHDVYKGMIGLDATFLMKERSRAPLQPPTAVAQHKLDRVGMATLDMAAP